VVPEPTALAARLARIELSLRSKETPAARLRELGRDQQRAYRDLGAHPEWVPQIIAVVPPSVRPAIVANTTAAMELRAMSRPRDGLPAWRIVAPAPADDLLRHYKEAQRAFGVPWPYLAAIHLVETRMGRIRGTSVAGARGPMQFLPATWARYGHGDIDDDRDAILAAGRYLRANGAPGNMAEALWSYNHSRHYVRAVEAYAREMQRDERAYLGYYHWQVYYLTKTGDVLLPEGYGS
jgi:hypothetical protein